MLEADIALISFDLSRSQLHLQSQDPASLESDFRSEAYRANQSALTDYLDHIRGSPDDACFQDRFEQNSSHEHEEEEEA